VKNDSPSSQTTFVGAFDDCLHVVISRTEGSSFRSQYCMVTFVRCNSMTYLFETVFETFLA